MNRANKFLFFAMWLAIAVNVSMAIAHSRALKLLNEVGVPGERVTRIVVTNAENYILRFPTNEPEPLKLVIVTNYVPFVTNPNHLCPQCTDLVMGIALLGYYEHRAGLSTNDLVEWMQRYFEHSPSWDSAMEVFRRRTAPLNLPVYVSDDPVMQDTTTGHYWKWDSVKWVDHGTNWPRLETYLNIGSTNTTIFEALTNKNGWWIRSMTRPYLSQTNGDWPWLIKFYDPDK